MNWMSFSRFTTLLGLALSTPWMAALPSQASDFTETAIAPSQVIAIARPYGTETTKYDLLMIEQIPNKKQCWQTSGADPVLVNPLLLNFDFTGHCRRATDSNGYSVRIDGQDYGLEYLLRIVPNGNELQLVATSRSGKAPDLVLGSTRGMAAGFMQIQLNPGWQFTKRTYQGKPLGHYYISGSQASIQTPAPSTAPPTPTSPSTPSAPAPVTPDPVQPAPVTPNAVQPSTVSPPPTTPAASNNNPVKEEIKDTPVKPSTTGALSTSKNSSRRPSPTPANFRRF